ncbi:receptor-like protein kinase 7 [Triticum dicoccoides]|uniref:receptor-like protein kinase 7 n=1 Tax=Triticum dicoccoides TaxID=85692 RepID=UPI00188E57B8|nr:receptor-like protein kinase 7 [Triticum dicoccoides]
MVRDDELHIIQVQGIPGICPPTTLVVKKFQNENPALQVDGNVTYRYKSEMIMLASNSHDSIIKVVDLIQWEDAIMLVYEYPVNGSLQSWLHQPMDVGRGRPLSWPERRVIAIGVAKGLCHMHYRCKRPIIHHNINSNNILLDQNFKPVIASFDAAQMNMAGLDQPLPIVGLPLGNFGYAAPYYGVAASELTEKVDTYSFGVLMLELVTGRMTNEAGADGHLATWARNNFTKLMLNQQEMFQSAVDRDIPDQARYMKEMATVFMLGVDCTAVDPQKRPSMRMALKRLRRGYGRGPFRGLLACYLM